MSRSKRIAIFFGALVLLVALGVVGGIAGQRAAEDDRRVLDGPGNTPAESLDDCPWGEASCVLALGIERALQFGNVDAVVEFAKPEFYDCPGRPPEGPGEPFPLCEGSPEYTRLEGYPVARRYSDGSVEDEDGLRGFIQSFIDQVNPRAEDDVGDGRLRLYAFGCPERAVPFLNVSCARLAIIFSAIVGEGQDAERELLIFWAVGLFRGKTLPVTQVWSGAIKPEEGAILFQTGGFVADLGEVYVIDQSLRRGAQ